MCQGGGIGLAAPRGRAATFPHFGRGELGHGEKRGQVCANAAGGTLKGVRSIAAADNRICGVTLFSAWGVVCCSCSPRSAAPVAATCTSLYPLDRLSKIVA